jgi:replication-associated recombination protein RarA
VPVIGHTEIRKQLADLVGRKRFPQTSIFYGPEGVGKRLVAGEVANYLLSERKDVMPDVSTMIENGTHPDFFLVEPTPPKSASTGDKKKPTLRSNWTIKVEQLNELKSKLTHHPLQSDFQVVIIDEAEKMTVPAANTLLKTIEEPRAAQVFILVTSRLGQVLPTLRSRSVKFHFTDLSLPEIKEVLNNSQINDPRSAIPDSLEFFYTCFSGSVSMIQRALEAQLDVTFFDELFNASGQFALVSGRIKELLKTDVDLDIFFHCFRTYCLQKANAGSLEPDEAAQWLKKTHQAEKQLVKHIPAEFVLENLFC